MKQTITDSLFAEWRQNVRRGDTKAITELSGFSGPTVEKALRYGNVPSAVLQQYINDFFKNRLEREAKEARELKDLREGAEYEKMLAATESRHREDGWPHK